MLIGSGLGLETCGFEWTNECGELRVGVVLSEPIFGVAESLRGRAGRARGGFGMYSRSEVITSLLV